MSELKACQKCGSTNVNCCEIMTDNPFREWCAAGCEECGFSGPEFDFDREADEEFQAMRDAIKAWNELPCATRPAPERHNELREALDAAHKQIYAAVQTTLAACLPGMKEPTRQAAAVSLALKLRELFAKGVA